MIRDAAEGDAAAVAALWNHVIRDTLATFNSVAKTEGEVAALIASRAAQGHGFLVAEAEGRFAGFATFGQFRQGAGYARTMEHTVHLVPEVRGRGIGRRLMTALEDRARAAGVHSMIAGVSGANPDGRAFHLALGYREVAVLPEVGWKGGRWLDLHLMQKVL